MPVSIKDITKSKLIWTTIFLLIMLNFTGMSVKAVILEEDQGTYILDADNISYQYQDSLISADGNVNFIFQDLKITAGELILDLQQNLVTAAGGHIILIKGEDKISGSHLEYNYKTGSGTFYGASSQLDQLNFSGRVIKLTPEQDYQYNIEQAQLTPCILPEPHYQIKAESIQIYPGEKIMGKGVQFWWGQQKLISLPYYVMVYREVINEEGYEEEITVNPIPIPRIGYDSRQGLVFKLIYPYYLNQYVDGEIAASGSQRGEQSLRIDNNYRFYKNTILENKLKYEKSKDDDIWQETYDLTSYLKYQQLNYQLYAGLHYHKEEELDKPDDQGIIEDKKLLETGLNYNKGDFRLQTQFAYNLDNQDREEKIDISHNLGSSHQLKLFHKYLNENMEKHSYSINSSGLPLNWNLQYRDGYDVDYYPYLTLYFPAVYNISTTMGAGKVSSEGVTLPKGHLIINYSDSLAFNDNFKLDFKEKLIYNLYERQQDPSNSQVFSTEISGQYQNQISDNVDLSLRLFWQDITTSGQFLLEDDRVDEKSIVGTGLGLDMATPQPQSSWNLDTVFAYDLNQEQWDSISLEITRQFDCYSLSLNYNPVNDFFGFDFEL